MFYKTPKFSNLQDFPCCRVVKNVCVDNQFRELFSFRDLIFSQHPSLLPIFYNSFKTLEIIRLSTEQRFGNEGMLSDPNEVRDRYLVIGTVWSRDESTANVRSPPLSVMCSCVRHCVSSLRHRLSHPLSLWWNQVSSPFGNNSFIMTVIPVVHLQCLISEDLSVILFIFLSFPPC